MQKLSLNLSELKVDSFGTDQHASMAAFSYHNTVAYDTQWLSCGGTCGTCGGTDCYA